MIKSRKISESINIEIENIDHLGIIAGIVDEVGIVEIVNQKLPSYPGYLQGIR